MAEAAEASASASATTASAPPSGKLSDLPQLHRYVTGHNADGKAVVVQSDDFAWQPYDREQLGFSVLYSTSTFPAELAGDADLSAHAAVQERIAQGKMGLVQPGGTVIRCVDFAPGYRCGMHRTQSLDYGIVIEGDIDMVLDSGETHPLRRGDVAVQRATHHQWVNRSPDQWARMMFVLQDCRPPVVNGEELKEDLGEIQENLPASGN